MSWISFTVLYFELSIYVYILFFSVDVESSYANSGKVLKHLSPTKVDKAFSSIQRAKLYSSEEETESILSDETVLDCDQTFAEENESILSYEDNSLLSVPKKTASKKSQNKVFTEKEQSLQKMNKSSSALSVRLKDISPPENRENRSCSVFSNGMSLAGYVLSKFTPKVRLSDIGLGISNGNCQAPDDFNAVSLPYASNKSSKLRHWKDRMATFSNCYQASKCNDKLLSYVSNKSTEHSKLRCREVRMDMFNKNEQTSNDCSAKLLLASNKSAELSKLSTSKIRKSDKNCKISNDYTAKSLSYDLNKSTEVPKLRSRGDKIVISNKHCQSSSDCNAKSLSNVSNNSAELSKFTFSKIRIESSNKNCESSSDCAAKSLSYALNKKVPKLKYVEDKMVAANKNCQSSEEEDCNVKSVSCASKKFTEAPKLRPRENGTVISNKDCLASSACNVKSPIYTPKKSIEPNKHGCSETKTRTSSRNCQTSLNSYPLKSTSLSSSLNPDISVEIDPLSLKKGSYHKKLEKKKPSLAQCMLPFQKCKSYTIEGANIDDLSFKKVSTPRKMPKNRQKDA